MRMHGGAFIELRNHILRNHNTLISQHLQKQVFKNLKTALAAGGASLEHVIRWNVYIVQGQPIELGFEVFQKEWGNRPNPPLITMIFVSGLANPDFLIEMDAVAVVPEE